MSLAPRTLIPLLALAVLSCRDKDATSQPTDSATCPGPAITAVSEDMSVTLGAIVPLTVDGTACTEDCEKSWTWAVEAAPVDSAIDTGDLVAVETGAQFTPDVVGTYVVSVVLSDCDGSVSAVELVTVTVSSSNSAPIADCGDNQTTTANQRVELDGSGSRDPEGAELEYAWTLSSVPDCSGLTPGSGSVFNGATVSASVVPDCEGTFVVGLAVSDSQQWSDADYCSINVSSGDEAPIADAGQSGTLSPCTERNYELNGFGSYDPEGGTLSYWWTLVSAPSGSTTSDASFSDQTLANPTFSWDETGTYTFQLQVNDGTQASAPDVVSITFTDENQNNRPIANAGDDQTINNTVDCETASYVFTCEECPADEVDLDGSASDDPYDGDELHFLWSDPTSELTFGSQYSPVTTATTPSFASEHDVTLTHVWDVTLTVSDCADDDEDTVTITYNCTAEYAP